MSLSSDDPAGAGGGPSLSTGNHQQVLQEAIKKFLTKVSRMILPHKQQLSINGTIGVTIDCGQCVLVHLSETVTKTPGHFPDSRKRIPAVLPFKGDDSGTPSTDDNSISHGFALEEDISGCTRGIVIDKEVEEDDDDARAFRPLVIQPLDDGSTDHDQLQSHRKSTRRKSGETLDRATSPDEESHAYTSKDYVKIPARLRCKSASQSDGLRSLLKQRPSPRKQRKSFMIPHRHDNTPDATYISSSEEDKEEKEEERVVPLKKRRWTASGGSPSKRKGLLLGMLLSRPSVSTATQDLSSSSSTSVDHKEDKSALRELLCGQQQQATALNLSLRPSEPAAAAAAAADDSQLRQLLCRPKKN